MTVTGLPPKTTPTCQLITNAQETCKGAHKRQHTRQSKKSKEQDTTTEKNTKLNAKNKQRKESCVYESNLCLNKRM